MYHSVFDAQQTVSESLLEAREGGKLFVADETAGELAGPPKIEEVTMAGDGVSGLETGIGE